MSLRTEFLVELNALAKQKDMDVPGLIAKMRQVMVGRHPATLSPEEQDPVSTVALAWKEVAVRGRAAFEAAAQSVIVDMERARINSSPTECDWPLAHAMLKLLQILPLDLIAPAKRGQIVRRLSGLVTERADILVMLQETAVNATAFWTDAFRLYLLWHAQKPSSLDVIWNIALSDERWPMNEAAFVLLEDAARRHPEFVTMKTLIAFWRSALCRSVGIEDLKRWFYVIGCSLEDSDEGRARLTELHDNFKAQLQEQRLPAPMLPRDHFIEVAAFLFRNPTKQNHIRSFKSLPKAAVSVLEHHRGIPPDYKANSSSVRSDLIRGLLNPSPAEMIAG